MHGSPISGRVLRHGASGRGWAAAGSPEGRFRCMERAGCSVVPRASYGWLLVNQPAWKPSSELLHLDLKQPFHPIAAQFAADHQPNGVAVFGRQDLAVHGVCQVGIVEQGFLEG